MIIIPIPVSATTEWPDWAIWLVGGLNIFACLFILYLVFKTNVIDK